MPNLERLHAKLAGGLVREPAGHLVTAAAELFVRGAVSNAPRDTGATASGITATVSGLSAKVHLGGPGAAAVEFGRHSTVMPPLSAIAAWAARHGLAGLEFPIARAIARRGIKGRFFVKRTLQKLREGGLRPLLRAAAVEIERRWAA